MVALVYGMYYYFLGGNKSNLGSTDFYIDDLGSVASLRTRDDSATQHTMMLNGVISSNFDERYIIIARKEMQFFNCREGNHLKIESEVQYMVIDKKSKEVFVSNKRTVFEEFKQNRNINLQFDKTEKEIMQLSEKYKESTLRGYTECIPVNNYPLINM